jgi:hypothetical protein
MMATCLAVMSSVLHAQELTVEDYIALTVDRLRIAEQAWLQQDRAPTPAETDPLWSAYATTAADYVAFGSRNRLAVASYLARHPGVRDDIEQRSQRIRALVSQTEPKP